EPLYAWADGDLSSIPWAAKGLNPNLVQWLDREHVNGDGRSALVIGCGLGDDAEELARRGFDVTAFDISPAAIEWCRKRFPDSRVDYQAADLFSPPETWRRGFDFVLESYTVQALPNDVRERALRAVAS